jgi:hypothetical protein
MNPSLVYQLVELAINLAQCELDSGDVEKALWNVVLKSVEAYEDHTGQPIDMHQIHPENPL